MSTTASPELTSGGPVTTKMISLYRVHLDRPYLDALMRIATERFTRAQTVLRSERDGTQFNSGSLNGLLAQIDRSEGSPDHLDDLQVECRAKDRCVTLMIAKNRADLTVSGRDAAWAHGKAEQLRLLLLRSGASERPVRAGPMTCGLAGAVGAAAVAGAIIAVFGGHPERRALAIAVMFTLLAAAAGTLAGRRRVRQAQVHLYVAGPRPQLSLWARTTIIERLCACSTMASLAGLALDIINT